MAPEDGKTVKDACWMLGPRIISFIQLGRYGDLLILFPAFREIHRRTGIKPVVLVANQYADLFDGVGYADAWPLDLHWYKGVPDAIKVARHHFGEEPLLPQWWQDPAAANVPHGVTVLQCHGIGWGVDLSKWPNFQTSMWLRTGLTIDEMHTLPLVFDRRSRSIEAAVVSYFWPQRVKKPLLLVNFTGISSPFGFVPEVQAVLRQYRQDFDIVDLGPIKAPHVYDLLGLYDRAAGLITTDTATLHLAAAAPRLPYVAFTVDGWSSSVPTGNCVLEVKYSQTRQRLVDVHAVLERWKTRHDLAPVQQLQTA